MKICYDLCRSYVNLFTVWCFSAGAKLTWQSGHESGAIFLGVFSKSFDECVVFHESLPL